MLSYILHLGSKHAYTSCSAVPWIPSCSATLHADAAGWCLTDQACLLPLMGREHDGERPQRGAADGQDLDTTGRQRMSETVLPCRRCAGCWERCWRAHSHCLGYCLRAWANLECCKSGVDTWVLIYYWINEKYDARAVCCSTVPLLGDVHPAGKWHEFQFYADWCLYGPVI